MPSQPGVASIAERDTGSAQQILGWMSGNLCRCGAYDRIVAAIQGATAAAPRLGLERLSDAPFTP